MKSDMEKITKCLYRMRPIGANTIMPVILFELNKRMKQNIPVDLAEAYVLLNDTQALYLARLEASRKLTGYYAEIEPKILALLRKHNLTWVLDYPHLYDYATAQLKESGFNFEHADVLSHPTGHVTHDVYLNTLLRAIVRTDDAATLLLDIGILKLVENDDAESAC